MSTKHSFNDSTGSMLTQVGMGSLLGRFITTLSRTRFILLRSPYSSLSQSPRLASAVTWAIWLDHRLIELVFWFKFKTTHVWKMISERDFCETLPNEISMTIEPFGLFIFTQRCSCHWSHLSRKKTVGPSSLMIRTGVTDQFCRMIHLAKTLHQTIMPAEPFSSSDTLGENRFRLTWHWTHT